MGVIRIDPEESRGVVCECVRWIMTLLEVLFQWPNKSNYVLQLGSPAQKML